MNPILREVAQVFDKLKHETFIPDSADYNWVVSNYSVVNGVVTVEYTWSLEVVSPTGDYMDFKSYQVDVIVGDKSVRIARSSNEHEFWLEANTENLDLVVDTSSATKLATIVDTLFKSVDDNDCRLASLEFITNLLGIDDFGYEYIQK